jgi:hypothetical protein
MKLITNRHRNVALLVTQGSKWLHIVTLASHGLEATKLTEEELTADWSDLPAYPLQEACRKFKAIAENLGATETARRLLAKACDELATETNDDWLDELAA